MSDEPALDAIDSGPISVRFRCNACGLDTFVVMPPRRRQVCIELWGELLSNYVRRLHTSARASCDNDAFDVLLPDKHTGMFVMDVPWPLNPDGDPDDDPAN